MEDTKVSSPEATTERTGFCQECGRGLSIATLRRVGNGVFCLPCAVRQAGPGWQPVASPEAPAYPGVLPRSHQGPKPGWAAVLGLVPGVGAMYNGQYAKGALHLVVFVVLLSLADNLNDVFYWFVVGWIFYQAFDAHHTARARRDGTPLPNPFGWNDVGERLGLGRSISAAQGSPAVDPVMPAPTGVRAASYQASSAPLGAAAATAPPPYAPPVSADANFGTPSAGFAANRRPSENPYTDPVVSFPGSPFASEDSRNAAQAPGMAMPFAPTYMGEAVPQTLPAPLTGIRRFPAGAVWLIGLGTLFLFGNLQPAWHLGTRWLVPILLAAVAIWSALRRWDQLRSLQGMSLNPTGLMGSLVGPTLLLTLAALLALNAGHLLAMRRSWPFLLVIWGAMLTVQRAYARPAFPSLPTDLPRAVPPPPVRSASGTGSLGL